jgi:hypothetical protein
VWLGGLALLGGGCATPPMGPTLLVPPGPSSPPARFEADQAQCRQQAQAQIAPQVQAANDQAAATAVAATAIGAAIGALLGAPYYAGPSAAWGAGSGLLVGGTLGASGAQAAGYGLQQRYDIAYLQCMAVLGYPLPGQAAGRGASTRPPLPPSVPPPDMSPPAGLSPGRAGPPGPGRPGTPPPDTPPPQGLPLSGPVPAGPTWPFGAVPTV